MSLVRFFSSRQVAVDRAILGRINPSSYPTVLTNIKHLMMEMPNTPGACMGEPSANALAILLHDSEITERSLAHLPMFEHSYYLKYTTNTFNSGKFRPLPKEFMSHLHHLLVFLKDEREPKTPDSFIAYLKEVGGDPDVTVSLYQISYLLCFTQTSTGRVYLGDVTVPSFPLQFQA